MQYDPAAFPSASIISPYSALSIGMMLGNFGNPGVSSGNGPWPVANLAIGCPFVVPGPFLAQRFTTMNKTDIAGRHFDMGIYDHTGRLLVSTGSLAMSSFPGGGGSIITVTPTLLFPDETYYMVIAEDNNNDNANAMAFSISNGWGEQLLGMIEATSSFPLPSQLSMVAITHDYIPPWSIRGTLDGF